MPLATATVTGKSGRLWASAVVGKRLQADAAGAEPGATVSGAAWLRRGDLRPGLDFCPHWIRGLFD
jgi:hypothetical protein